MDPSVPSKNLRSLLMPSGLPRAGNRKESTLTPPPLPPQAFRSDQTHPSHQASQSSPSSSQSSSSMMSRFATEPSLPQETRQAMFDLLTSPETAGKNSLLSQNLASGGYSPSQNNQLTTQANTYLPAFMGLKAYILQDLETHLAKLLALNVSRREAVAQYLDRLSGQPPGPTATSGSLDAAGGLRRWMEGPRSPAQNAALQTYLEEVALITLGQATLLKAWSDRGLRAWTETDLKDLNWAMHTALKPHIPLDRESWQVARQNIYSWYKPSPMIQREIWGALEGWRLAGETPLFLSILFTYAKKAAPEHVDSEGYDSRFFKAIWDSMPMFGFDPSINQGPFKRHWAVFSPTLRDGAMVRTGPVGVHWIGLEGSCFQLMLAELMQLWWGQAAPPLWAIGNGLEVHTRDQLTLGLGSPKPSLNARIAEMEACDASFVLEERSLRAQGRSAEAQRFRDQVETVPYFKKLRAAATTLGDLQACVALSKLRPGGLLWWSREEPLEARDGSELLNFLLERGKLICEWNFTDITHALPSGGSSKPLFPKFLYLFIREPRVEERFAHRPLRLAIHGQIRSHVELPLILEDALHASLRSTSPRGQWQIHVQQSPSTQKEWVDRWPDPTCQNTVRFVDRLRDASQPLASATTIRQTPDGDPTRNHAWSVHPSLHGFWIQAQHGAEGRKLLAQPLPRPGREAQGSGFLILVADENSIAPLRHYLESETIHQWLEYHCERRGERWNLNEQVVRWIPVPKLLLRALGLGGQEGVTFPNASSTLHTSPMDVSPFALPLPSEWERLASQLAFHPSQVREAVDHLRAQASTHAAHEGPGVEKLTILTEIFVRTARTLESLRASHAPLLNLVTPEGKIRWAQLLKILSKSEAVAITLHPRVTLTGSLPPHLPIGQITTTKTPTAGILLATEAGLSVKLHADSPLLLEMIWDQLDGLNSPTWNELVQYIRLPRRLEVAETTATDVLRSHGEQSKRINDLVELLSACTLF